VGGHRPQLDRTALQRLRATVTAIRNASPHSVPLRQLVDLGAAAPPGAGITIDFEASHELGDALIVVRVPAQHDGHAADSRLDLLSRREREVAHLIASGLSNKLIADRLCIATSTVKDHVHHIFQKTGLSNRAAIAAACRGPLQAS
jgi:DNA-binding NarL/FixJ family response regulator